MDFERSVQCAGLARPQDKDESTKGACTREPVWPSGKALGW